MQITAPVPIYYLPENLWSLFTRPGRELTVKVLQIEGKLLYLELGGYKFQARLAGTLNPEDFKPGELLKVKVLKSEGPVVLEVIESSKSPDATKLLYLLARERPQGLEERTGLTKETLFFSELLRNILTREETKEKKGLLKDLEELLGKNLKISDFVLEEDRLFLPFLFLDEKSWGYLELTLPEEKGERVRVFVLKLFFQYLGLVEAIFYYSRSLLILDLFFAENLALNLAKENLNLLKESLPFPQNLVKINLARKETLPGYFLERIG